MALPFMASSGLMIQHWGPLTVSKSHYGERIVDNISGDGFFITPNGERTTIADGLVCNCGSEFTVYVRQHLDPFPYSSTMMAARDIYNLWPERRLKLQLREGHEWKMAKVVSFSEWISGPCSPVTIWSIKIKIEGDDSEDSIMDFAIERTTVNEGGTLTVDGGSGEDMQKEIPFEWLDPAFPPLSRVEGTCYHGSSEANFTGEFQEAANDYVRDTLREYWQSTRAEATRKQKESQPEHISPKVEGFIHEHSDLVTEEFCQHLYAWCLQEYLTGSLSCSDDSSWSVGGVRCLMVLANNLRYRYLPDDPADRDIRLISKYARDIHTDRGVARTLAKEIDCPCTKSIREKTERMEKVGTCFGCHSEMDKFKLKDCSQCQFAKYCSRECQLQDWPEHKAACKYVRRALRGVFK